MIPVTKGLRGHLCCLFFLSLTDLSEEKQRQWNNLDRRWMVSAAACAPFKAPSGKAGVRWSDWGQTVTYGLVEARATPHLSGDHWSMALARLHCGAHMQERVPPRALSTHKCTNKSKSCRQSPHRPTLPYLYVLNSRRNQRWGREKAGRNRV